MTQAFQLELDGFRHDQPIEAARTPPASWYLDSDFYEAELRTVFRNNWIAVGRTDQVQAPGQYFTGELAGEPYVVVRDEDGQLRAFFNVCRHHAACVAQGDGQLEQLVCPYHGWTYRLDGQLRRAPRLGKVSSFDPKLHGLREMSVQTWGPLVFLHIDPTARTIEHELALLQHMLASTDYESMRFLTRKTYSLRCNWKVFVDNYLDGGYHVDHLHHGLAEHLDLSSYDTKVFDRFSVQTCRSTARNGGSEQAESDQARIGRAALYAWVHPNLMINRYGPFMDVNLVLPKGPDRCEVVFDYFLEEREELWGREFIDRSLAASHAVQEEDTFICESVQAGMASSSYDRGIYAPALEHGMHHFHRLLARDLRDSTSGLGAWSSHQNS